ncbi:MAG: hypothetical protein N3G21_08335 [Candidatus Hydrogenedentes bacterium]|nr:hypothetical protein [Candidatus Hydrogenedentota bacterium]
MSKKLFGVALCILSFSLAVFAQSTTAYLIVDIAPTEVNDLGAGWKVKEVNNLSWLGSGYMLALSANVYTSYTVTFKPDVYGWKYPADIRVTVQPGKYTKVVGIYEQVTGSLKVNIYPKTAVDAGAKWRRAGQEIWRESGYVEQGIPLGKYTIEFYKLSNWDSPPEVEVTIKDTTLVTVNAYYSQYLGALQVNISPQEAVVAGAGWKIVGKTDWLPSGFKYENLPVGSYTIEFRQLRNWQPPPSTEVQIERDQTKVLNVDYVSLLPEGEGEGEALIEGEGEGEGAGDGDMWSRCGCNDTGENKGGVKLLLDLLFIGLLVSITASSRNYSKL